MALFIPILGQISGKVAGNVFAHNKSGQYIRQFVVPTNPNTAFQGLFRSFFAALASRWANDLSLAQRASWTLYGLNTPVINRVGISTILDGLNWYISSNVNRLAAGAPIVDDGPAIFGRDALSSVLIEVDSTVQIASITFDETDAWLNEDDAFLVVSQGQTVGPGINFFRGPFRPTTFVAGQNLLPPSSPVDAGILQFPVVPDQRSYWRFRTTRADGRSSPVQIVEATVI